MGSQALIDTNILVDVAAGIPAALAEVRKYENRAISVISRIEFMTGIKDADCDLAENLLSNFVQIELTPEIVEEAIAVRRRTRLKLPDAVLLATAIVEKRTLVTRNTRDFKAGPHVRIPYERQGAHATIRDGSRG